MNPADKWEGEMKEMRMQEGEEMALKSTMDNLV